MVKLPADVFPVSDNLRAALKLAAQGVAVFPCKGKRPLPQSWRAESTTSEQQIKSWFKRWPSASPAIDLAKSPWIVVDLDGPGGFADWDEIRPGGDIDPPYVNTPSGGRHLYFVRGDWTHGNARGALPKKRDHEGIDIRGCGGYVLAPGAETDAGRYTCGPILLEEAPPVPAWLVEVLSSKPEPEQEPELLPSTRTAPSQDRQRSYGETALAAEAARVARCPSGGRNEALNRAAFSLGQLVAGGCLSESEVRSALEGAAVACKLAKEDGLKSVRATISSGLKSGKQHPRTAPDDSGATPERSAEIVERFLASTAARLKIPKKTEAPRSAILDAVPLWKDGDWTEPDGLIKEMADWIIQTSRKPNRPLAIAAATAVMSGVCGRWLYSPTDCSLNLYIVMLAGTTVGKNRPLSAVLEILRAAGLDQIATTAKGFSVSAIEQMIVDHPCCVATVDEIGPSLLAKMSHFRANGHELAMRGALLELWSRERGMAPFSTHHRAASKAVQIPAPSLSLVGTSQPEAFYKSLTAGSVTDGFLNRFLLCPAAPRAKPQNFPADARKVPQWIIDSLQGIVPTVGGNLGTALGVFALTHDPEGKRLEFESSEAEEAAADFEEALLDLMDINLAEAPLMGRTYEYMIRLASLHAVSRRGIGARVSLSDLRWGASWSVQSTQAMIDGVATLMAATEYEQRFNTVMNVIREAGEIAQSDLLRQVRSISARERNDVIEHLEGGGWIQRLKNDKSRKSSYIYRWIG